MGLYDQYKEWVRRHNDALTLFETGLSSLTWFLPDRFSESELGLEALHTGINLLSSFHEHILSERDGEPELPEPGAGTAAALSALQQSQVLVEVAAIWGERHGYGDRFGVLAGLEAVKALLRLEILRRTGARTLLDGGLRNPKVAAFRSAGRDAKAADVFKAFAQFRARHCAVVGGPPDAERDERKGRRRRRRRHAKKGAEGFRRDGQEAEGTQGGQVDGDEAKGLAAQGKPREEDETKNGIDTMEEEDATTLGKKNGEERAILVKEGENGADLDKREGEGGSDLDKTEGGDGAAIAKKGGDDAIAKKGGDDAIAKKQGADAADKEEGAVSASTEAAPASAVRIVGFANKKVENGDAGVSPEVQGPSTPPTLFWDRPVHARGSALVRTAAVEARSGKARTAAAAAAERALAKLEARSLQRAQLVRRLALLGEMLHIARPVVHAVQLRRYGRRSWRPWLWALGCDVAADSLAGTAARAAGLAAVRAAADARRAGADPLAAAHGARALAPDAEEIAERARRRAALLWYLLRDPIFGRYTRPALWGAKRGISFVPGLDWLPTRLLELLDGIQRYYTYTCAN